MYLHVRDKFDWLNSKKFFQKKVRECDWCVRHKAINLPTTKTYQTKNAPSKPFQKVYLDLKGPLPVSSLGNRYASIWIDGNTGYIDVMAIPTKEPKVTFFYSLYSNDNNFYNSNICLVRI